MTNSTIPILDDDAVAELQKLVNSGALQLPLRVEGWHISLSDGGWLVKHSSGRTLATVAFVPVEIETGKPALDGNAPARTLVALLNSIPALCNTVRVLRDLVYVPKILPDDEEVTYQQEVERLLRAKVSLESQLEQVTTERDSMRSRCVEKVRQFANEFYPHEQEIHEALNEAADELKAVSIQDQETRCADCAEAARLAYSDATTPGFFSPKCARHREQEAKQ